VSEVSKKSDLLVKDIHGTAGIADSEFRKNALSFQRVVKFFLASPRRS